VNARGAADDERVGIGQPAPIVSFVVTTTFRPGVFLRRSTPRFANLVRNNDFHEFPSILSCKPPSARAVPRLYRKLTKLKPRGEGVKLEDEIGRLIALL